MKITDIMENGPAITVKFSDGAELFSVSTEEGIRIVLDCGGCRRSAFVPVEGQPRSELTESDKAYLRPLDLEWAVS